MSTFKLHTCEECGTHGGIIYDTDEGVLCSSCAIAISSHGIEVNIISTLKTTNLMTIHFRGSQEGLERNLHYYVELLDVDGDEHMFLIDNEVYTLRENEFDVINDERPVVTTKEDELPW